MRSRTHRMTCSDPPDDWVDGSWTVDCVCGVTFDDGEEMVNCDECGVWVHTRCSRYVKGEKLFACDKCKSKNSRNDSEETEVAQLLVELPTKTMRMESSYHLSDPPRRPLRLWTDIPMEERVHVQGIPGGDPALFSGLSSVFTPELWKCTGYVPKKFNFQYREFPCWDENKEVNPKIEQENENPVDKGANVLFSLSKETVLATPVATLVGMKARGEEVNRDRKASSKEIKKWQGEKLDVKHIQYGAKKERSLIRPFVVDSHKRRKDDLETSKDRSGKKRAMVLDKKADSKERDGHSLESVASEFFEDKVPKFLKTVSQNFKSGNLRNSVPQASVSDGNLVVENNFDKPKNSLAANEHPSEAFSCDMSRHGYLAGAEMKQEKSGNEIFASVEKSDVAASILNNDVGNASPKQEVFGLAVDNLDNNGGDLSMSSVTGTQKPNPPIDNDDVDAPQTKDSCFEDSNAGILQSTVQLNVEKELEVDVDDNKSKVELNTQSSTFADVMSDGTECLAERTGISADHISGNTEVNDAAISSLHSGCQKVQDVEKSSEAAGDCHTDKQFEVSADYCQSNPLLEHSDGCMVVAKSSSEAKHGLRQVEEQPPLGGTGLSPPPLPSQRKMVVCVGKSLSSSSSILMSKSPISDNGKPEATKTPNPLAKEKLVSPSRTSTIKKDHASRDAVKDGNGHEMPRRIVKEHPKSSVNSGLRTSHSSRTSEGSIPKHTSLDSKHPLVYTSSAQNVAVASGSGELAGSLPSQSSSHGQNKITSSGSLQRGEKFNHSSGQQSSKVNHSPATHPLVPSNSSATLSDEELALLLHQELNSSPRVPRVPRVRQVGSLPQLASPTATSMLLKRTSSFGGKEHSSVSRRKVKDVPKDGSRNSHEFDRYAKKTERLPFSSDQRRQDSVNTADASSRREADNESFEAVNPTKKNISTTSSVTASSGRSSSTEATGQNSLRDSPRNVSDDDTGTVGGPAHQTLPGLINEIMSKGRRMTYEELCNAVLPHWHNLRKHNGERYAYSSHSQAVLDCLRNRTGWAQLVDRGPKTNASRKRRKVDAEPSSFESEGYKLNEGRTAKEVEGKMLESHREEFPKGKRKARKPRGLALQGRGIKDVRKKRKVEMLTDEDIELFSNSSEESMFSEDEIPGGGTRLDGSEASASSDEAGTIE